MKNYKCPFCGSKKVMVDTPYIDVISKKPIRSFCCKMQKTNQEYLDRHYKDQDKPELKEMAKL